MDSGKKWLNLVLGFSAVLVVIISILKRKPLVMIIIYIVTAAIFLGASIYYFRKEK